jgi:hypothetical protein
MTEDTSVATSETDEANDPAEDNSVQITEPPSSPKPEEDTDPSEPTDEHEPEPEREPGHQPQPPELGIPMEPVRPEKRKYRRSGDSPSTRGRKKTTIPRDVPPVRRRSRDQLLADSAQDGLIPWCQLPPEGEQIDPFLWGIGSVAVFGQSK